jgi:hypothetical protein
MCFRSEFTNNRGTVFLVHGWRGYFDRDYQKLRDELLIKWRNMAELK